MRSYFERLNEEQMRRDKRTRFPNVWSCLTFVSALCFALVLAHGLSGAVSEAVYQSINTPKGW